MAALEINFLGSGTVRYNGQAVAFETRKTFALFAYLVVERKPQSREKLATLLWSDSDEEKSRAALRKTLARLNTALEGIPCILVTRDSLHFQPQVETAVDLYALELASTVARDNKSPDLESLEAAALLYQGEFLEGWSVPDAPEFDEWVALQRENNRLHIDRILGKMAEVRADHGERQLALQAARQRLKFDPINENACQELMRLQFAAGDHLAALETFAGFKRHLQRELGVEPAEATIELVGQLIWV